jgi:MFS family permease
LILVSEREKRPETRNTWESMRALPGGFFRFLMPLGLFGISNFAPTLLILRAQDLLSPSVGATRAGVWAAGLYTFGNVMYAVVGYPIGVLADRYDKKLILSLGYLLYAALCLGFFMSPSGYAPLVGLFALNGIYTAIVESSQPALASTLIPDSQHGAGFGLLSAVDGVGDFLSSVTIGLLWTYFSPELGFGAAGVAALTAALWMFSIRLPTLASSP